MEEKKLKEESKKKLTYEQLEAYASQLTSRANEMARKMQEMQTALQQANMQVMYQDLHFAFEVLKYSDKFHSDFVDKIVHKLEEVLDPVNKE